MSTAVQNYSLLRSGEFSCSVCGRETWPMTEMDVIRLNIQGVTEGTDQTSGGCSLC